jgi:CBS domain containing-hemolysin-like protein
MSSSEIILGLLAIGATLFFTTAVLSLRGFSHGRLEALLEKRGQQERLEKLIDEWVTLTLSCATLRVLSMMGIVLVTLHVAIPAAGPVLEIHYLESFVLSAVLILMFGVGIPSAWATHAGERFLTGTLPVLHVWGFVMRPVTAVLKMIDTIVRRLAGIPLIDEKIKAEQLGQEILSRISAGEKQGLVDEQEANMIESVMQLRNKEVHEIMTPRTEVIGIPATAMIDEVREVLRKEGHSRYPVYDESIDKTTGVLYVKDLLTADHAEEAQAGDLVRKVPLVPESKPLRELLRDFQENKVHMAIVLDEYGGMAGLVTIEDILEELVGEIVDEYEPTEPIPIQQIDSCTAEIDARVHIDELNEAMDIELPEDEDYDTIGGFVFTRLGKIPAEGEEVIHENVRILVLDAEERKVNRVRIEVERLSEEAP